MTARSLSAPAILLFATASLALASKFNICEFASMMSHRSVLRPFSRPVSKNVQLTLYFRCSNVRRALVCNRPLLLILPGALTRPSNYSMLATRLARKGFVVAIPDYTLRDVYSLSPAFKRIDNFLKRTSRFGCPRNGQLPTAQLVNSVLLYFLSRNTRVDIRRSVNLRKTIIFGHSAGGPAAEYVFNRGCEEVDSPLSPAPVNTSIAELGKRIECEQYAPLRSRHVKILGIVTFEGFRPSSVIDVSKGNFYVAIYSPFYRNNVKRFFTGKNFSNNAATVLLAHSNHYAPMNFVRKNRNQKPACALSRRPPENMFETTKFTQDRVIKSIAYVISASYRAFAPRKRAWKLRRLSKRKDLFVENVRIL